MPALRCRSRISQSRNPETHPLPLPNGRGVYIDVVYKTSPPSEGLGEASYEKGCIPPKGHILSLFLLLLRYALEVVVQTEGDVRGIQVQAELADVVVVAIRIQLIPAEETDANINCTK